MKSITQQKNIIQTYWPLVALFVVELMLVAANYKPGTWLMGWDNVMPEFNFKQAFITNILGAWQYHRGLGLPDGMGHAANLVHTLFLWLLSTALPQSVLRYTFHFLMHLAGGVGMYTLLRSLTSPRSKENNNKLLSLVGSLFYMLNLITIQMFYTPLEAFSVHYAALPWLAYSLLRYLRQPSRNTLLLFISVSILSTTQFFIPTLMLPTAILLVTLSISSLFSGSRLVGRDDKIKRILAATGSFLCVNAFWLMPYLYNLPYNAPIIAAAKINQMSSGEVYARNQVFGDLKNVLTMKGFMLDFEDVNVSGQPIFVMVTWRNWLKQPTIQYISILISLFMFIGLTRIVVNKISAENLLTTYGFGFIWLVSFVFLANNTPGISTVMNTLRDHVPFFSEAYRFPFTKFSLLFAFASTILFVKGFSFARPGLAKLITIILMVLILFSSFPAFQGHFFYDALRVKLPKDYIALFAFMDKRDHNGRIANLPQPSYWSWKHYNYGYVGSGFVWYGLSQPIMDRAFDPWSQYNEQYYRELSHALYSNDATALNAVLSKYDVRYIIFDGSLLSPGNNRALIPEETKAMLSQFRLLTQFGALSVYEKTDRQQRSYSLPTIADSPSTEVYNEVPKAETFKPCGILKQGVAYAEQIGTTLRMHASNQRGCISFGIPTLSHRNAYRVTVTSRHISGRPVLFSLINNTAKHIETENYLTGHDVFTLPPLSSDGLGYTMYITNEGFGSVETVNDIVDIRVIQVPHQEDVSTPIPTNATILSQAYNPNWVAFDSTTKKFLSDHRIVNTWENGWDKPKSNDKVIFMFLPQLLEYAGLAILGALLLMLAIKK